MIELTDPGGAALLRRHVGRRLAVLRQRAGYSQETAATALQRSSATIWRMEAGDTRIRFRDTDVSAICDLYGVDPHVRDRLLALTAETRTCTETAWWHAYTDGLPFHAGLYPTLECHATTIRCYGQQVIPDLLQIPAYAEAALRTPSGHLDEADIARRLKSHSRRRVLLERAHPPQLRVVINEGALHRSIGGRPTMAAQLVHLLDATERPGTSVRILPFERGAHAAMANAFTILDFPSSTYEDTLTRTALVYVDSLTGALYLDRPAHVETYERAWRDLDSRALDERASQRMIIEVTGQRSSRSPSTRR